MISHLTTRVAWHDSRWNGTICKAPSLNSYCIALERIRQERIDALEDSLAGSLWGDRARDAQPPCIAERAGFMNDHEWMRHIEHPYRRGKSTRETHGALDPWSIAVPPYSTFAVPFWWMLRKNQDD